MPSFSKSALLLEQWKQLSIAECEEVARELERRLPERFRFHRVSPCMLGDQKHRVAFFEWEGPPEGYDRSFFALIPGGEAQLGYDRAHPFEPDEQQRASWEQESAPMIHKTLNEYLDMVLTPLRRVFIEPFLLEVIAHPLAPAPVFNEQLGPKGGWKRHPTPLFHHSVAERIARWGEFRFPTSDEWEYACAAGARTLFRWGNDTPALSIPRIGTPTSRQWQKHLQQNAFGLFIARNPYHWEFCQEPGIMRGGDGGSAWQVGAGAFATWLTLASAFYQAFEQQDKPFYGVYLRRAYSLDF